MRHLGILSVSALMLLCRPVLALEGEGTAPAQAGQRVAISSDNLVLATRHFDEATQLYRAGKFNEARIEFEASYALTQESELLHNLSLTAERQGKLSDAIDFEERFLASKPSGVTQRDEDEARGRIMRLRQQFLAASSAPSASSATVLDRASTPASEKRRVAPGAVGLLALGGVAVAVGIGCGAGAWATARAIDGMPLTMSDVSSLTARGQALDRAGIALDVIGTASLVAGATWMLVERFRPGHKTAIRIWPLASSALVW